MLRSACLLAAALFLAACDSADAVQPGAVDLELVYLPELRGGRAAAPSVEEVRAGRAGAPIDIGEIRRSQDYYFLLRNRGTATVDGVRITLSGAPDGVSVSPEELDGVPPFGSVTSEEALGSGLIRMSVEHGEAEAGGYAPPLEVGPLRLTLRAVAGDGSGGRIAEVDLSAFVRVADVSVFDANGEVDLLTSDGSSITGGFEAQTFVPNYRISGPTRVVNTGNVEVLVERFDFPTSSVPFTLAPGEGVDVLDDRGAWIAVSEADAVRDTRKLPILANGKTYFFLRR